MYCGIIQVMHISYTQRNLFAKNIDVNRMNLVLLKVFQLDVLAQK